MWAAIAAIFTVLGQVGTYLLGLLVNSKEKNKHYQDAIEQSYTGGAVMAEVDKDLNKQIEDNNLGAPQNKP